VREISEARLLADASQGYGLTIWLEERSRNTGENARNSAALLQRKGINQILLVTDRAHMTRAMLSFQRAGIEVAGRASRAPAVAGLDAFCGSAAAAAGNLVRVAGAALVRSSRALLRSFLQVWCPGRDRRAQRSDSGRCCRSDDRRNRPFSMHPSPGL
jgi:hypothetical protein